MAIRTTYQPSHNARETLTYVREGEMEAIADAVADGKLLVVAQEGEIIGAVTPEIADEIIGESKNVTIDYIASVREELKTLRQIVREVMTEKVPADFEHRIALSIEDAEHHLSNVEDSL